MPPPPDATTPISAAAADAAASGAVAPAGSTDAPPGAPPAAAQRRAVADVLVASVLFAACNVAWRFGQGSTIGIVVLRSGIGAVLAWGLLRRRTTTSWREVLRTRVGLVAVVVASVDLIAAATLFRTLDGPMAGLAVACTPAVALLVRDRVGGLAAAAALGSSGAAVLGITLAATDTGSAVTIGWVGVLVAGSFVAVEVASMRTAQLAVEDGADPTAIVLASLVVAGGALAPVAAYQYRDVGWSVLLSALVAAAVVAVLGTIGRILRTAALPAAGVPAVAASTQVTALGTAVGGVVIMGDAFGPIGLVCTALAAGLGAAAVVAGTRWRLARDRSLAAPLDVDLAVTD